MKNRLAFVHCCSVSLPSLLRRDVSRSPLRGKELRRSSGRGYGGESLEYAREDAWMVGLADAAPSVEVAVREGSVLGPTLPGAKGFCGYGVVSVSVVSRWGQTIEAFYIYMQVFVVICINVDYFHFFTMSLPTV